MEITQDKINLISKLIKNDRKFQGHEDLYEDFLNETCSRSAAIISAINNDATLETYLRKIVTTSILKVLKDSGRLRRTRTGYMTTTEVPLETPAISSVKPASSPDISFNTDSIPKSNSDDELPAQEKKDYSSYIVDYENYNLPASPEENAINNEVLEFVAMTIQKINKREPKKKYLDLFILRYNKGMTQKEISQEMGISQSEVSKRLYRLIDKVKKVLDEQ